MCDDALAHQRARPASVSHTPGSDISAITSVPRMPRQPASCRRAPGAQFVVVVVVVVLLRFLALLVQKYKYCFTSTKVQILTPTSKLSASCRSVSYVESTRTAPPPHYYMYSYTKCVPRLKIYCDTDSKLLARCRSLCLLLSLLALLVQKYGYCFTNTKDVC